MASTSFRLQAKNLFLTYPKCNVEPSICLENIKKKFGEDLLWAVVGQETHADGDLHLHCAIALNRKLRTRDPRFCDELTGKHGDYLAMKSQVGSVTYVTKDGNYVSHGINVKEFLANGKMKKSTRMAVTVYQHGIEACNKIDPGFTLMHLKRLADYKNWCDIQELKTLKPEGKFQATTASSNMSVMEVVGWLNDNILCDRQFKQEQLYIYSPPNMGKTSLINKLRELGIRVYDMSKEKFYCSYDNGLYDLIVLDEFKGQKCITELNQWLDGSQFPVPRKGLAPIVKKENLPIIICSNYSVEQAYRNSTQEAREPLDARLKEVCVTAFLEITCKLITPMALPEANPFDSDQESISISHTNRVVAPNSDERDEYRAVTNFLYESDEGEWDPFVYWGEENEERVADILADH